MTHLLALTIGLATGATLATLAHASFRRRARECRDRECYGWTAWESERDARAVERGEVDDGLIRRMVERGAHLNRLERRGEG